MNSAFTTTEQNGLDPFAPTPSSKRVTATSENNAFLCGSISSFFNPAHLLMALCCVWDGGLKEFEFADRYLGGDYLGWAGDPAWEKAKEIWERG